MSGQSVNLDATSLRVPATAEGYHPWYALALLAAMHFLVDTFAGTANPIWPTLERNLSLESGGLLWVYVCWSIATSFSQLLFGIWSDRRPCAWLIWFGPLTAILALGLVGWAGNSLVLAGLFILGGCGIAAFHPEAAATAGSLIPEKRSRAMAIFALCGYFGQSLGPFYSGTISDQLGLRGLAIGIVWGVPLLLALRWGARKLNQRGTPAERIELDSSATRGEDSAIPQSAPAGAQAEMPPTAAAQFPIGTLLLLLAVGASRVLPALGVPLALAYLLQAGSASNSVIGAVQSAFMAGIGTGAMACATFVRTGWERTALWLFPLLAAPLLASLRWSEGWTLVSLVGSCGFLLGITMPVFISYGQQLLPHGQRVASSITMGVSWGIGGALVATAMWVFQQAESLPAIFFFFAISSLASSLLCCLLPRQ